MSRVISSLDGRPCPPGINPGDDRGASPPFGRADRHKEPGRTGHRPDEPGRRRSAARIGNDARMESPENVSKVFNERRRVQRRHTPTADARRASQKGRRLPAYAVRRNCLAW